MTDRSHDAVGLQWLVNVRWTTLAAGASAFIAGRQGLDASGPWWWAALLAAVFVASNVWLRTRVRERPASETANVAGALVCLDVLLLSWALWDSGGVLNPASVFYLVVIVAVALALGRGWTWTVATLAVVADATMYLAPPHSLGVAQTMHPEVAAHMRGMWIALALAALIIAILVTRLVAAVEKRDQAIDAMRDRATRASRVAGLTTVAAGAAHELGTPLATIAVAAHELERALAVAGDAGSLEDARLIRRETERCRQMLERMIARIAEPMGEAPRDATLREVLGEAGARLAEADRDRVAVHVDRDVRVLWPVGAVLEALANVVRNALQASPDGSVVTMAGTAVDRGDVRIDVTDRGHGMTADVLARAGEPFYTTKAAGSGTGLGLFVTRSVVEQLGGAVTVTSTIGEGTTVVMVLPSDVVHGRAS